MLQLAVSPVGAHHNQYLSISQKGAEAEGIGAGVHNVVLKIGVDSASDTLSAHPQPGPSGSIQRHAKISA